MYDDAELRHALGQVPLFAGLSDEELTWVAERGTQVRLEPGQIHRREGDPAEHVFVMLDGELRVTQKAGDNDVTLATYGPLTLFGELPILMGMTYFFASGRAVTACRIFELPNDAFWQMLAKFPSVSVRVLRIMAGRIQDLELLGQGREKLVSLGTLAAGLALELNDPAEGARSAAGALHEARARLQAATLALQAHPSLPQSAELLAAISREVRERARGGASPDPAWLQSLAQRVPADVQGDLLRWVEATLTAAHLLDQIENSAARISDLVGAVKSYAYMDQAPMQKADVHEGLENTLTMLGYKLRKKNITVTRDFDRSLPPLCAYGSELNQVWTSLLVNAIDAVDGGGRIGVRTARDGECILVEIIDNGTGIAPEAQAHLFEPFFTTKDVGHAAGLGLITSYRIVVGRHAGDIRVHSEPGDTHFEVRLPIEAAR